MEVNDDVADLRDKVALVIYCMFNNDSISHTDWKNIISEMFLQSDESLLYIYSDLEIRIKNQITESRKSILASGETVASYNTLFIRFKTIVEQLNMFFGHLNTRIACKMSLKKSHYEIKVLFFRKWFKHMISPLKEILCDFIVRNILYEQNLSLSAIEQVNQLIDSFAYTENFLKNLTFYEKEFEANIINSIIQFFQNKKQNLINDRTNNCVLIVNQIIVQLEFIENQISKCIPLENSREKIIKECHKNHKNFVFDFCFNAFKSENWQALHKVYKIVEPLEFSEKITIYEQFNNFVKLKWFQKTSSLNKNNPNGIVENLILHYQDCLVNIKNIFENDKSFIQTLNDAVDEIVNHRENPISALDFVQYIDSLLIETNRTFHQNDLNTHFDYVSNILKYVKNKTAFQKFYARALSKRLIYFNCSNEYEKAFLEKLSINFDRQFVLNSLEMLKNISDSKMYVSEFQGVYDLSNLQLTYMIGNSLVWPLKVINTTCNLSSEIETTQTMFENFYQQKVIQQKLTWLNHLSIVNIELHYTQKLYSVHMTFLHASIFLLFENSNALSYNEIEIGSQFKSDRDEVSFRNFLHSFVSAGILLPYEPHSNKYKHHQFWQLSDYCQNTMFQLNFNFVNQHQEFKLMVPIQREIPEATPESVAYEIEKRHKFGIEAFIVRTMKKEKKKKLDDLYKTALKALSWKPSHDVFMKSIATLTEKDFIEVNKNECVYVP